MRFQSALLGSKVARRLLLIFIVCALVPLGVISFVTFDRVTDELYAQSQKRLHQVSKAAALTILGRLLARQSDLVAHPVVRSHSLPLTVTYVCATLVADADGVTGWFKTGLADLCLGADM